MEREQTMTYCPVCKRDDGVLHAHVAGVARWTDASGVEHSGPFVTDHADIVAERNEARDRLEEWKAAQIASNDATHNWKARAEAAEAKLAEYKQAADAEAFAGDEARADNKRLREALNRGDYWRDTNDLTGQKLVAAEAERDEARRLAEMQATELGHERRTTSKWILRAEAAEAELARLREALEQIEAEGTEFTLPAVLIARAALAEDTR